MPIINIPYIDFTTPHGQFYICNLNGKTIVEISYVARRGQDEEEGAVQRILNKKRIKGIKEFLLNNGFFPNSIILNLINRDSIRMIEDQKMLELNIESQIAQIIDGQHRVEGIKEAIKDNENIGNLNVPTVIAINLSTQQCAEIFLSINTEQKTVPKSLIYDLYGLMNISSGDFSIERGTDIASILNKDDKSPYQGYIKFPGSRIFKGGIQLSTFVSNLKQLVKSDGEFIKYSLNTLENQASVIMNYFNSIQSFYGKEWVTLRNPFIFASGFSAAIEVFINKLLPYCYAQRKFTEDFFKSIISIPKANLIYQEEVKGLSGEAAREHIKSKLLLCLNFEETQEDDFEI